jgi:hypothetical protein
MGRSRRRRAGCGRGSELHERWHVQGAAAVEDRRPRATDVCERESARATGEWRATAAERVFKAPFESARVGSRRRRRPRQVRVPAPPLRHHTPIIARGMFSSTQTQAGSDVESPGGGGLGASSSFFSSWRSADSGASSSYMQVPTWLGGGGEESQEEEDPCACFKLTYQQRMMGFATCFVLGTVISIMSTFLVLNPVKFALPYTLGNILSLMATAFLIGPRRLVRYMCAPVRYIAACIYIGALIATLVSALYLKKGALTLLFVVVQFGAYLWFVASYIPYGRTMLTRCCQSLM